MSREVTGEWRSGLIHVESENNKIFHNYGPITKLENIKMIYGKKYHMKNMIIYSS